MTVSLNKRRHHFKLLLLLTLIPALVAAVTLQDLPDFGDSAGGVVSPEYERRLGQMFLREIRQSARLVTDAEVESYIQSLGQRLASHSDNASQAFSFFVIDDPRINAFAGPGGVIGMHSGIILNSDNESEVAGVMAHEIAHVTQRHLARQFEEASRYRLPTAAALLGAILVGIANRDAGAAAIAGISGLNTQNRINFTRMNEEEADRIGMQVLAKAGYDPRAMPSFFEKLQQLSRYSQSGAPEFLRTHPLTSDRIADSRARAERFPPGQFTNSTAYELARSKLRVDSFKTPREAVLALRKALESAPNAKRQMPLRYGLAHAYINNNDFPLARRQIDILLRDKPEDSAYLLLAARLETRKGDYEAAFRIYEQAYGLYPDYKPVIMAYSRALLDVKRAKKARAVLKDYERQQAHDLRSYSLLGQAEAMLGNEIEVAILQAEYYYLAGDTGLAVDKLEFTRQHYALDYYQAQRVAARLSEFEYELELQEALKL